jgi:hypothetical protein
VELDGNKIAKVRIKKGMAMDLGFARKDRKIINNLS